MFERHGFVILDLKGLVMHSYHRCNDRDTILLNEAGEKITRAIAAFETFLTSYMIDILKEHPPIRVIGVWDSGNERRRRMFDGYKLKRSQREKDPVQEAQLNKLYGMVKNFLAGLGCFQVSVPMTEADDVIAYLTRGIKPYTIVHTVDNDLLQLASETCLVMVHHRTDVNVSSVFTDERGSEIPARLIALYKSIVGDSSDEYPGIKGMGMAAWENLVAEFGIDGMEELDQIARDQNANLLQTVSRDVNNKNISKIAETPYGWFLQYELARLHPEWCEGAYNDKLVKPQWFKRVPNRERAMKPVMEAKCQDLWHNFEPFMPVHKLVDATNVDELLYNGNFLDDLNVNPVAFDYEGYDPYEYEAFKEVGKGRYVDVLSQRMTGASFCWGDNYQKAVYVTVDHARSANVPKSVIADFLMAADTKIVQNAQYEQTVTVTEFGEDFMEEYLNDPIDTMIMSSYVDENEPDGLKENSLQWLRYNQTTYEELLKQYGVRNMHELSAGEVLDYGLDDSITEAHLWVLFDLICMVEGTADFLYDYEFTASHVFNRGFRRGCRINERQLEKMKREDQAQLDELWPKLRDILQRHCTAINEEATQTYHEETRSFTVASMQANGKSEDDIQAKLARNLEAFRAATVYTPYSKKAVPFEFKPTIRQITDVLRHLGIPAVSSDETTGENVNAEYYPATAAASRITEWVAGMHAMRDSDPLITDDVMYFVDLVAQAAHQFKARQGDEYEALATFVGTLFADRAKVVEEGDELNFDSPVQMAQILYGKLALPIRHYSKVQEGSTRDELGFAGGPAANDKAIEIALAEDCQNEGDWRREVLLTIREIKKLQTKFKFYYVPYPLWVHPKDGRIHPQVRNCGTATKRPSGTSPNILQVAKGPTRSMYLPVEVGHILVAPDFSGQELRILASESLDKTLLDAYIGPKRRDIHSLTSTALMPNLTRKLRPALVGQLLMDGSAMNYDQFEEWRKDDEHKDFAKFVRDKRAKPCNFLVNYEGGAGTLSTNILVPRAEAQEFIDNMFRLYPGIPIFQEASHKLAQQQGYVTTAYGNRRHMLDSILSRNDGERMRMERQASNYRIQGCAADILKVVVTRAEKSGLLRETGAVIMAPVYDELVCSVPVPQMVYFCQELQKIMNLTPPGHLVPMEAEFDIGYDWYHMVEVGTDTSAESLMAARQKALEMANKAEKELVAWEISTKEEA